MIKFLRSKGSTYFVKAILGLIILSFVPWGVSNLVQNRGQGTPVARIGTVDITQHALVKAIESTLMQNKLKITMAEALSMGIAKTMLDNQVASAAMGLEIQDLKLTVDQSSLERSIKSEALFHNEKGKFDPQLFKNFLSSRGMSEAKLKEMIASSLLEMQLVAPLGQGISMPKILLDQITKKQLEKRAFTVIRIPFDTIKDAPSPKEEDMKTYYQNHQDEFTTPEYRTFDVLVFDESQLQKGMPVDEREVKDIYQKNIKEYGVPEKRHLRIISREDKATATSFKNNGVKNKFKGWVDLGLITKEMAASKLEPAVQKAAFSLKKGDVSEPIKIGDSYYVVAVENIAAAHTKPLAAVHEEIASKIRDENSAKQISDFLRTVDDQIAGGATLSEIEKQFGTPSNGLKVKHIENVNIHGTSLASKDLPKGVSLEIIKTGFDTSVDTESPRIDMEGGTVSYMVRTKGIKPAVTKSFEDAKPLITKKLATVSKKEAALKKAKDLQDAINQKKSVDLKGYEVRSISLSDRFEIMVTHASDAPRSKGMEIKENSLLKTLIDAFGTPKGNALAGSEENAAVVVRVDATKDVDPKSDPRFYKKIKESIEQSLVGGMSQQFINALKDKFNFTIYQEQLDQLNNGGAQG